MIKPIPRLVLPEAAPVERNQAGAAVSEALRYCQALALSPRQKPWLRDRARVISNALEAFQGDLEKAS